MADEYEPIAGSRRGCAPASEIFQLLADPAHIAILVALACCGKWCPARRSAAGRCLRDEDVLRGSGRVPHDQPRRGVRAEPAHQLGTGSGARPETTLRFVGDDSRRRALRTGFDRVAEDYQRTRPICPPHLFDDLTQLAEEAPTGVARLAPADGHLCWSPDCRTADMTAESSPSAARTRQPLRAGYGSSQVGWSSSSLLNGKITSIMPAPCRSTAAATPVNAAPSLNVGAPARLPSRPVRVLVMAAGRGVPAAGRTSRSARGR